MQAQQQRALVGRLRAVLADAMLGGKASAGAAQEPLQTPRNRRHVLLEITSRIDRWGWQRVLDRALAEVDAPALKHLDDAQLAEILSQLQAYEDILHTAADMPDTPPAR